MNINKVCFKKNLFGKYIEIVIYDIENFLAEDIIEEMYKEAIRLQKIFNFFDDSSEISLLNKKRSLKVSNELLEVILKALKFCELTKGEYDISIGKKIVQRKRNNNLIDINCSYKDIGIKDNLVILNNLDVLIDLGSLAKGYITDKLIEFLKLKGIENGLIDSRGDISFFGNLEHIISIEHPRKKEKIICSIKLKNESVATSGDYKQFSKSFKKSHILNQKDVISVTVVAPTLEEADIFATVLFVSDNKQRENILKNNKNIKVLIINNRLNLKMYNGFQDLVFKIENEI